MFGMMHEHTDECLNGCTALQMSNGFLAGLLSYPTNAQGSTLNAESTDAATDEES